MPGWFANGRADKERMGGNARDRAQREADPERPTGSGFQKREGFMRKIVKRTGSAIVDNTTGRIMNSKAVLGVRGAKARIKKGVCAQCGGKLRGSKTYNRDFGEDNQGSVVCSKKCAIKLEAAAYDTIQTHMDKLGKEHAARSQATTHAEWMKITGGIQYDNDGKRIW